MASILTYIELVEDRATWGSILTLRLGRDLASRMGATLYALLPCASPPLYGDDDIIAVLSRQGADKVILVTHSALIAPARFRGHGEAVLSALHQFQSAVLLFPAGPTGEDIAPRVAARLGACYAHLPRFSASGDDESKVEVAQPLFAGTQAHRFLLGKQPTPLVATVAPDPQQFGRPQGSEEAEVVVVSPTFPHSPPPPDPTPLPAEDRVAAERVVLAGAEISDDSQWADLRGLAERLDADLFRTPGARVGDVGSAPPLLRFPPPPHGSIFVLAVGVNADEWTSLSIPPTAYRVAIHGERDALEHSQVHLALQHPIGEALQQLLQATSVSAHTNARGQDYAAPKEPHRVALSAPRGAIGTADTMSFPVAKSPDEPPSTGELEAASEPEDEPQKEKGE